MRNLVFLVVLLLASYFFETHGESYQPGVTLCWITTPNLTNTNTETTCPFGLHMIWNKPLPEIMDPSQNYESTYSVTTSQTVQNITCSHANLHACVINATSSVFCSPLISINVDLKTVDLAQTAIKMVNSSCTFTSEIHPGSLKPGNYTIIAHVGIVSTNGPRMTYALAIGEYRLFKEPVALLPNVVESKPWLIPVIVIPVLIIIAIIIILIVRRRTIRDSSAFANNIPPSLRNYFDIARVRSKYQLDSPNPRVYRYKVAKKSEESELLETLTKNLDFREIQIEEAYAIYPEALVQSFFIRRSLYQTRLASGPGNGEFFKDNWKRDPKPELRRKVFEGFNNKIKLWPWNEGFEDISQVPILAVVHGTDLDIAWKITRGGFVALQKLDAGYYGRGIYLTSSAWYTIQYFGPAQKPAILVCLVLPCNPYPIVETPKASINFVGLDIVDGYQSHYVHTAISGFPIDDLEYNDTIYDELVLQEETQVLPIFVLSVDKVNIPQLFSKMKREMDSRVLRDPNVTDPKREITSSVEVVIDDDDGRKHAPSIEIVIDDDDDGPKGKKRGTSTVEVEIDDNESSESD